MHECSYEAFSADGASGYGSYTSYQIITVSEEQPLLPTLSLSSSDKQTAYDTLQTSNVSLHSKQPNASHITTQSTILPAPAQYKQASKSAELYGYLLLALASISFSVNDTLVHFSEVVFALPPTAVVFIVALVITLLSAAYLLTVTSIQDVLSGLTKKQYRLMACRGVVGAATSVCLYGAFSYIPTGEAAAIFFVGPALTVFFAAILLGEKVTPMDIATAIISVSGAVIVSSAGGDEGIAETSTNHRLIGCTLAMMAAVLSSLVYILIRSVVTSMHFMLPVFSLGVCEMAISAMLGGVLSPAEVMHNPSGVFFAVVSGVFAFVAQMLMQKGLQHSPAGCGSLVRNLEVPMVYILGIVVMHEMPTPVGMLGSVLVVSAAAIIGLRQLTRDT